jgi:hypothetical protein
MLGGFTLMRGKTSMYSHTQFGAVLVTALGVATLLALAALMRVPAREPVNVMILVVLAVMAAAMFLFRSLTVEVSSGVVAVWFGSGLISRRFPVGEIRAARVVRNPWYYGWGIRLTPGGWMFNVSGFDAVELELTGARRFRIGTDEPRELVTAIRQAANLEESGGGV